MTDRSAGFTRVGETFSRSLLDPDPTPATPPASDDLRFGVTREAHVQLLVTTAFATISALASRLAERRAMKPAEREDLSRRLAGVIGACESIRLWLSAGAPR